MDLRKIISLLTYLLRQTCIGVNGYKRYKSYHTRILFFERYVRTLTYSILAYAYPRALVTTVLILPYLRQ